MPLTTDPDKADVLVMLDVHNFMLRCYFAKGFAAGAKNKQGYHTGHIYLAFQKLRSALVNYGLKNNKLVCLMLSAQENSHVRRKKYKRYKAQREAREYETYDVKDAFGNFVERVRDPITDGMEFMLCFPCVNLQIPNADGETDDALGCVVKKYRKSGKKIYILTEDHDAWFLMSDDVTITSKPGEEYTKEHLMKLYGITNPKKLPLVKAIFGDSSDNIENVKGFSYDTYKDMLSSGNANPDSPYLKLFNLIESMKKEKGEKTYSDSLTRVLKVELKSKSDKKLSMLLDEMKNVRFRERLVRLKTKIEITYLKNKGNVQALTKLLNWYEIKKDFNSAVALASSVK